MRSSLDKIHWERWAGVIVVSLAALLFLTTIQTDINGADTLYTPDVGEITNALNLWGTIHQAGYPLWTALGSTFVFFARLTGASPALSAGLWSWSWALVVVAMTYVLVLRLTGRWAAAAAAAAAITVSRSLWVNASIAELQSFSLTMAAVNLWVGLRAAEAGPNQPRWFAVSALVFGVAISHGRALVLLGPALGILLWRPYFAYIARRPAALLLHAGLVFVPWLAYLYLPLRVNMGAIWTFGKPNTWESLRPFITADETRTNITVPVDLADWFNRTLLHFQVLNTEFLAGVLAIGLLAALVIPLLKRQYTLAAFFTLAWLPFFGAAYLAYVGYLWDAYVAVLMPATLVAVLGLGMLIGWLLERRAAYGLAAIALLLAASAATFAINHPYVTAIQHAGRARELIETFKQAEDFKGPGRTVLAAPWGLDYFALAYGTWVNHEIQGVAIADQTAHFADILKAGDRVYVLPRFFYVFDLKFWDGELGHTYLTSAAPGIVRLSAAPALTAADVPAADAQEIGDSIRLLGHTVSYQASSNSLLVTLYWEAAARPTRDYSVFVHLSDQPAISSGDDILAQSDSETPVYGFYPTSRWSAGEIVREDYSIPLPDSRRPILAQVGLYTRSADGGFNNLGVAQFSIELP